MANIDSAQFKKRLEDELKLVEEELTSVGRRNPTNPADWEATVDSDDVSIDEADRNEVADRIETFEEHSAILKELEIRFNNIKQALQTIETGTYGICTIGGEEIELARLEANPAALTCKVHMGKNPQS